ILSDSPLAGAVGGMMPYTIKVNGATRTVEAEGETPLLWVLRDLLDMKGSKFGCGLALCGCCTVHLDGSPIRACVTPLAAIGTKEVTTVEAVGDTPNGKKVQGARLARALTERGCCQAGQIMSATALLNQKPQPTDQDIDDAMSG